MCVNSSNIRSKVCVSYDVKSESQKLNDECVLSMFSGGLSDDVTFSVVSEKDIIYVNYYSDKLFLLNDYLQSEENCNTKFYAKEFCKFILSIEGNTFLLDLEQIFCDENGLYFVPSLFDNNSVFDPVQAVRCFLNSIANISEKCFSDITEICTFAQGDGVTVLDIIDYIDNCSKNIAADVDKVEIVRQCPNCSTVYEDKYVFCMKCGCKLQEMKKETETDSQAADEKTSSENIISDSAKCPNSDEISESEEPSEKNATENTDKTAAIENFNTEPIGGKKIKHLKVRGLKHSVQKKAENTTELKQENSELTEYNNDSPADEEQAAVKITEKETQTAEQVSLDTAKSKYGETTLLGFTNYGETAVLNGMANNFDMPNLIRKSTDEKIYISKRIFVIGKSADKTDYAVNNSAVSRVHAEISVVGSEYYITDKGSTNHTYVNHSEILPNSPHQIFDGDEIMFANEIFTFHFQ